MVYYDYTGTCFNDLSFSSPVSTSPWKSEEGDGWRDGNSGQRRKVRVCVCVCVCVRLHACMNLGVCMCAYMHAWICVCVCVYLWVCTCVSVWCIFWWNCCNLRKMYMSIRTKVFGSLMQTHAHKVQQYNNKYRYLFNASVFYLHAACVCVCACVWYIHVNNINSLSWCFSQLCNILCS